METASWSVSGLSVLSRTHCTDEVVHRLNGLPGVEVHGREPGSGRLVVVHEAATVGQHKTQLKQIQAWPEVLTADLVMFVADDGADSSNPGGA